MKVLLDTNIVIALAWQRIHGLKPALRDIVESQATKSFLSVATIWEISLKWRLGKLEMPMPPNRLEEFAGLIKLEILQIAPRHVYEQLEKAPDTKDPFDHLLLAQCQVERLRLLTTDRALSAHPLSAVSLH